VTHRIHHEPLPPRCPVVYLPGVDGTGRLLHRQPGLRERYELRCVSYPQDDRHSYADLVAIGTRHLEETGPGVLLAESFGGAIALMIALARPELVRRLVLVNTFAWYPRRLFIRLLALVGPWLPNKPSHPATRGLRGLFFFGPTIPKAEQDAWWDLTADVPMRAYGHRFRLLADLDLRPRLHEIDVPALVFVAPNDWVVPAPAGRALAKRLPQAKLIETAVGHAGMIDPRVDVAAWLECADHWPGCS
jgi:pimeloyl-ACP methyl ester carboxylesterase